MTQKWMISPYRDGCTFLTNFSIFCCSPRYGPRPPQEVGRVKRGALFWALVAWAGWLSFILEKSVLPPNAFCRTRNLLCHCFTTYVDYSEKTIDKRRKRMIRWLMRSGVSERHLPSHTLARLAKAALFATNKPPQIR